MCHYEHTDEEPEHFGYIQKGKPKKDYTLLFVSVWAAAWIIGFGIWYVKGH